MFNDRKTVWDVGENDRGDEFGGDVKLCVIGLEMEVKSMVVHEMSEG